DVLGALGKLGIVSGDLFVKGNALDVDLLTLNRNLHGLSVVNDVLADTHASTLDSLLAHVEALLVADDRTIPGDRGLLISRG
ncbi:hypothetical protein NL374_27685, partial [Klebsiella pneumoniae]|nr:hypothetical protein [Klebsiella pneumoniae]